MVYIKFLIWFHDSFYGDGISAVKTDEGILVGRPHGGLAVLWRKSLNAQLQVVKYDDEDRVMGIVVKSQRKVYHFLNVYLPYECKENVHDFTNYLCKMHTIFMNNNTVYNLAVGDFNANITRDSLFGLQLLQFCEDNCYTLSDSVYMPDTSFTFHSDAHDTISWLDHAVSSFSEIMRCMRSSLKWMCYIIIWPLTISLCLCVCKLELRMNAQLV